MHMTRALAVAFALVPAHVATAFDLYFATDVGVSLLPNVRIKDIAPGPTNFGVSGFEMNTDAGLAWTASLGAKVTPIFGVEIQSGWIYNDLGTVSSGRFTTLGGSNAAIGGSGDLSQVPILFNALVDLPIVTKESGIGELKLQFGGGLGPMFVDASVSGVETVGLPGVQASVNGNDWVLGFQGTAAIRWSITPNIDLGVRYRFMGAAEANLGPATFNTPALVGLQDVKTEEIYTNAIQASVEIRF